jgi:hypothetical protein
MNELAVICPQYPRLAPELEEPLAERRRQRVLAGGRHVHLPVHLALGWILLGDVRRVPHHRGVVPAQHRARLGVVFEGELPTQACAGAGGGAAAATELQLRLLRVVQQRVRHHDVQRQRRRIGQLAVPGLLQDTTGQRNRAIATAYGLMSAP